MIIIMRQMVGGLLIWRGGTPRSTREVPRQLDPRIPKFADSKFADWLHARLTQWGCAPLRMTGSRNFGDFLSSGRDATLETGNRLGSSPRISGCQIRELGALRLLQCSGRRRCREYRRCRSDRRCRRRCRWHRILARGNDTRVHCHVLWCFSLAPRWIYGSCGAIDYIERNSTHGSFPIGLNSNCVPS